MTRIDWLICSAGFATGIGSLWMSRASAQRLGRDHFWQHVVRIARAALTADENYPFFREYLRLWPALAKFLTRQVVIALAGIVPIAVTFLCLVPLAGWPTNSRAAAPPSVATPEIPVDAVASPSSEGGHRPESRAATRWEFAFFASACLGLGLGRLVLPCTASTSGQRTTC